MHVDGTGRSKMGIGNYLCTGGLYFLLLRRTGLIRVTPRSSVLILGRAGGRSRRSGYSKRVMQVLLAVEKDVLVVQYAVLAL
jgi:hypothetical protein